jgi:Protein of unknown function (DUF2934)
MFGRRRNDPQPPRDPIHDAIERRAFELFLARGGRHGHDLDDWLQAEREFLGTARTGGVGVDQRELVAAGSSLRPIRS